MKRLIEPALALRSAPAIGDRGVAQACYSGRAMTASSVHSSAFARIGFRATVSAVNANYLNRSSSLFPVRLSADEDTVLDCLHYWKLKNNNARITLVLRLYSAEGVCVGREVLGMEQEHLVYSFRRLFPEGDLFGMAEVEVLSPDNLRMVVPGLSVFYRHRDCWSVVHSLGRVRNPHEPYPHSVVQSVHQVAKFGPDVRPWLFVYNGPDASRKPELAITLYGPDNQAIDRRLLATGLTRPFASRTIFLDEAFELERPGHAGRRVEADSFFIAEMPDADIFPRTAIGNFFPDRGFWEAEHNTEIRMGDDFIEAPTEPVPAWSTTAAATHADLDLEFVFYPTNCAATVTGQVSVAVAEGRLQPTGESLPLTTGGPSGSVVRLAAPADATLVCIAHNGESPLPARMKCSNRYRVRGGNPRFSKDIASGNRPWYQHPHKNAWGHGLVSRDFETLVLLTNIPHTEGLRHDVAGQLKVWDPQGRVYAQHVLIPESASRAIALRKLMAEAAPGRVFDEDEILSWMFVAERPSVDANWIAYAKDGRILGDHCY